MQMQPTKHGFNEFGLCAFPCIFRTCRSGIHAAIVGPRDLGSIINPPNALDQQPDHKGQPYHEESLTLVLGFR